MARLLDRRPLGWLIGGLVASVFVLGALVSAVVALVQAAFGSALWAGACLLFWFWIAAGALKRTHAPAGDGAAPEIRES